MEYFVKVMAKIIYKEGREGQNSLECIEGIEIELLNGQKALIYPKYSREVMLADDDKICNWDSPTETEMEALTREYTDYRTEQLVALDSPAAMWVTQFHADKYGVFTLPSLLAAMEIQYQMDDIDALAETIEGADLLRNFTYDVWTCSRYNDILGWIAVGSFGFADKCYLRASALVVPTILYR